jgi:hypothetical protein
MMVSLKHWTSCLAIYGKSDMADLSIEDQGQEQVEIHTDKGKQKAVED